MARKKIDRDVEVIVISNMYSYYSFTNGRDIAFQLDGFESEDYLTYGELKALSIGRSKKVLQNMGIIILDVLDQDITKEDVIQQLRLKDNYDKVLEIFELDSYDDIIPDVFVEFIKTSNSKEIKKVMSDAPFLKNVIEEITIELYRKSQIDSSIIATILQEHGIKENDIYQFLEDIKNANEE